MQSRKRSEIVFVTASISFQNALNTSSADFHVSFHHFRTVSLIKSINAVSAPIKTSTTLIITSMEVLTKSTINGTAYATIHSKRGCKTDSQNVCKHSAILPITSITVLRNGVIYCVSNSDIFSARLSKTGCTDPFHASRRIPTISESPLAMLSNSGWIFES